jgi:hypothetical protein
MTKAGAAILILICTGPLGLRSLTSSVPARPSAKFPQLYTKNFPELYLEALDTFFTAEAAYRRGDYSTAAKLVDTFWARHPAGSAQWERGYDDASSLAASTGLNFGAPIAYCALRMLAECAAWRTRAEKTPTGASHTIQLTVILVGHSSGVQATSVKELLANEGSTVHHDLDPALNNRGREIIDQSLWLFFEYVRAMTGGKLNPKIRLLRLSDLDIPVYTAAPSYGLAEPSPGAMAKIWEAVDEGTKASTDWWWILYPSHVPEQYPEFTRAEFITGGMATGPDGRSPAFLIDDRWIVRKPPHLGQGPYTEEERRAYLPQWFQHEFFHHLYRTYPELRLEVTDHQWFDRKTWPSDFQGSFEPDYYAESLHKRLQSVAPPLHVALRYAAPPRELYLKVGVAGLAGRYRRDPVENGYHHGVIQTKPLRWSNDAGKSWRLSQDLAHGVLLTGPDNPYYDTEAGRAFRIVLRRGPDGDYLPEVAGFQFNGEMYVREGLR